MTISKTDKMHWLDLLEKVGYDFQKVSRNLDPVSRLKYISFMNQNQIFTVPTQARLSVHGKTLQDALQHGSKFFDAATFQDALRNPVNYDDLPLMGINLLGLVEFLGRVFRQEDSQIPKEYVGKGLEKFLEKARRTKTREVEEALNALGIPSGYGRTNVKEDFAETFVLFVTNPQKLSNIARWRMGRTLGIAQGEGTPIMKLAKRVASLYFNYLRGYRVG